MTKLVDRPVPETGSIAIFGTVLPNCSGSSGVPMVDVKISSWSLVPLTALHRVLRPLGRRGVGRASRSSTLRDGALADFPSS